MQVLNRHLSIVNPYAGNGNLSQLGFLVKYHLFNSANWQNILWHYHRI